MPGSIKVIEGIRPDWPAPPNVGAFSSFRYPGHSLPPYDSFNLGDHVGDDVQAVANNRLQLINALELPGAPAWLKQVHGKRVVEASEVTSGTEGDASYTSRIGVTCVVLTADCLPVLICDRHGTQVAAVHAGWRGLAGGVIEATVKVMQTQVKDLMVWLGPAIGPASFEVGDEVRQTFVDHSDQAATAFRPAQQSGSGQHWYADIYLLARQRLNDLGVTEIYGGQWCTYRDDKHFFSYRRDGVTGRMATLIRLTATTETKS